MSEAKVAARPTTSRRAAVLGLTDGVADALLVTAPANVRYLTGFSGSNGQLLLAPGSELFLTDGRYDEQSASQVPDVERHVYGAGGLRKVLDGLVAERGISRLGIEAMSLTVGERDRLADALPETVELAATTEVVEGVRAVKSSDEVDAIRAAQRLTEAALEVVLSRGVEGTEVELAMAIEWEIRSMGAEAVSFPVIVAGGEHSALPHADPRRAEVDAANTLLIDVGAVLDGYCSDMTRTFLGPRSPEPLRSAHAAVVGAMDAAIDALAPGVALSDVDAAARAVLEAAGFGDAFTHSLGHGVGLEIHEAPSLGSSAEGVLSEGMVVTVEPGVYLPGHGGVRGEELVVVGRERPENLTAFPRDATR